MIPLQVILDTFDAGHILCRNPQSAALLLVLDKSPEMDDAILHNDVFQGQVRPRFRREPSEKLFANSAVINAGRFGNFDRRQGLQQVAARDDAHHLAVADDGNTLYAMVFQRFCDLSKRGCRVHGDEVGVMTSRATRACALAYSCAIAFGCSNSLSHHE